MRIHHIKLKNYRSYLDAEIKFSSDPVKNFTIIQGSNGAGKSNILNAVTWCLYGEERHLRAEDQNRQLPIINEQVYHTLRPGEQAVVEVEVALGDSEIKHVISRQAKVFCQPGGEKTIREDKDPKVTFLSQGNWHQSPNPTMAIKFLLPSDISHFFFFDAEQLDEFFREGSARRVKQGVVDVSQISLLDQAIGHLEGMHTDFRRTAQGTNPQVDRVNRELEEAGEKLRVCRDDLRRLDENQKGLQDNLEQIQQRFRNNPIEEVRRFEESRERLEGQIKDNEKQLDDLIEQAAACLRETGPRIYAFSAIKTAQNFIQERVTLGELPLKIRSLFFGDLLAQGKCVCGQELAEGSDARIQIRNHLNKATQSDYLGQTETGRYIVNHILRNTQVLVEKQRNLGKEIYALEASIEEAKRQLRELSEKIRKYGEINLEEINILEQQHDLYQEEQRANDQEIGRKQVEEKSLEKEQDRLRSELERALKADQRKTDLRKRLGLCTEALQTLKEIRSEMLSEVRSKIQQKTEEYFLNLIWKKATYKSVTIDENYQINVLNVRDMPSLGTLSAGERQVLALAFMAALSSISGFDAPVIIDTPTGRISGKPRENIAESLPNYLADTQVTLLMTDTEFTEPVQMRLNERIGQEYSLNFLEHDAITEVMQR